MFDRPPDKLCDQPDGGCQAPVWFVPTDRGRAQVVDADGRDHHGSCIAWLAMVARERARDGQDNDRLTLF
jgi:hypothetical protein